MAYRLGGPSGVRSGVLHPPPRPGGEVSCDFIFMRRPVWRTVLRCASTRTARRNTRKQAPRQLAQATTVPLEAEDASQQSLAIYESQWRRLLQMEHDTEQQVVLARLNEWPLSRLVREGFTLVNLSEAKRVGTQFGRDLLRFRTAGLSKRQHGFDVGDEAIISRNGPLDGLGRLHRDAILCELVEVGADSLSVSLEPGVSSELVEREHDATWRLDRGPNTVAHQRTCHALAEWTSTQAFGGSPALRRAIVEGAQITLSDDEPDDAAALAGRHCFRAAACDGVSAELRAEPTSPSPVRSPKPAPAPTTRTAASAATAAEEVLAQWAMSSEATAACTEAAGVSLNSSQRTAVLGALQAFSEAWAPGAYSISLIQGPPGTGKSSSAVALLKLAARGAYGPLLATADSNAAVDNLLESLLAQGIAARRVGRPGRPVARLWAATVEAHLAALPEYRDLSEQREQLRQLRTSASELVGSARAETDRVLRDGWRRVRQIEARLTQEVLADCEVVVSTLVGCGSPTLLPMRFPLVVVDESTQATEPRTVLALARAQSSLVLIGDQQQLAPTCVSLDAAGRGLARSLFERMLGRKRGTRAGGLHYSRLTIQYRMHPRIRAFPSRTFYGDTLTDGCDASARAPPPSFVRLTRRRARSGGQGNGPPLGAPTPALSVAPDSQGTFETAAPPEDPSPLAFHDASYGRERRGAHGTSWVNELEASCIARLAAALLVDTPPSAIGVITPYAAQASEIRRALHRHAVPRTVEVKTVDGFQGREKEVILFSAVRANGRGDIGFLSDERRLNVGLTRARRALLVVGCRRTLSNDPTWGAFIAHCNRDGGVLSAADLTANGVVVPTARHSEAARRATPPPTTALGVRRSSALAADA